MKTYAVIMTEISKESGAISRMGVIDSCATEETARQKMRAVYEKELNNRGLPDNGTSDENGNSVPGGYITADEAGIYEYMEYANDQLLQSVVFCVQEVEAAPLHEVNIGDHVYVVAPKLKRNTLGRTYRMHEHEIFKGEVWSVKYDADDAVFVEVFAERNVTSAFGMLAGSCEMHMYRLGTEAFLDEESANKALEKANKDTGWEDTDDESA